ncbi:MAG: hypothetical protein OEV94_11145 [Deltaproteobacteria bacterium]|nr:hypothetical protein [Deltaproteobacteria bacterium]
MKRIPLGLCLGFLLVVAASPALAQTPPKVQDALGEEVEFKHGEEAGGGAEDEQNADKENGEDRFFRWTGLFQIETQSFMAGPGQMGYVAPDADAYQGGAQRLRWMGEWNLAKGLHLESHLTAAVADNPLGNPAAVDLSAQTGAGLFRAQSLRWPLYSSTTQTVSSYAEIDRLKLTWEEGDWEVRLGRQPIAWGAGRFWQPTDVFGAFSPTEVDTTFKPGVDALVLSWFPGRLSQLSAAWVAHPSVHPERSDHLALHFRQQVGEESEMTLLAAQAAGMDALGGSLESTWFGAGVRVETLRFAPHKPQDPASPAPGSFTVAGADYQFANETLLAVEIYHHTLGAVREDQLPLVAVSPAVLAGLQKHLSQNVAGVTVSRKLDPLLTGALVLLAAPLDTPQGVEWSTLRQLALTYSISDEADALIVVMSGTGKGLSTAPTPLPQSEFGALPSVLSARIRFYF